MRPLATIQKISNLTPIEGADKIELAKIQGWDVIVKKEEFKIGDLCIYIEIDSQLPETEWFEFLRSKKFRIRTMKMRGVVSQGIAFPLSLLKNYCPVVEQDGETYIGYMKASWKLEEDFDLTEILQVTKYDPGDDADVSEKEKPIKTKNRFVKWLMRFKWFREWYKKQFCTSDNFPSWIVKTDETRIQNLSRQWDSFVGKKFICTEKLDGQSGTFFVRGREFGVCSRNLCLNKKDMTTTYWQVAVKYNIEGILKDIKYQYNAKSVVMQGEILAPGVQGNKYHVSEPRFYVFNLIIDGVKLNTVEINTELASTTINIVPYLGEYTFTSVEDVLEYVKGNSVVYPTKREGCVFRLNEDGREISWKAINNDFLLSEKD